MFQIFPWMLSLLPFTIYFKLSKNSKKQGQANYDLSLERSPTLSSFVSKLLWEKGVLYAAAYNKRNGVDPLVGLLFNPTLFFAFLLFSV